MASEVIQDILDIYRAKTPEDRQALWDRLYEYEKSQRVLSTIPDRKPLPSQAEKGAAPRPEDFGAVPVAKSAPRPEDFGAFAVRGTAGMSTKILASPDATTSEGRREIVRRMKNPDGAYEARGKVTHITGSPALTFPANVAA